MKVLGFDSNLPNLERGGWEPGMYWAPTHEQLEELEVYSEAERITDFTYELGQSLIDDPKSPRKPQNPDERIQSIQENVAFLWAKKDYQDRPLDRIVGDVLAWIDGNKIDSTERYNSKQTLQREASALLARAAENPVDSLPGSDLQFMAVRWAAIEYVMHHYSRDWYDGVESRDAFLAIEKAGVSNDEFNMMRMVPMSPNVKKMLNKDASISIVSANQMNLESEMLKLAKDSGVKFETVHPYSAYLYKLGQ